MLLQLPIVANLVANLVAARTRSALDHAIPDLLPLTGRQWLIGRLVALGLPVTTIVTSRDVNAYHYTRRVIELGQPAAFKSDPVYWSSAAHELGHALFRLGWPRVVRLFDLARRASRVLAALGLGLTVGAVMFHLPTGAPAFACWAVAATLTIPVLIKELVATRLGLRELRPVLSPRDYRAARLDLAMAFGTYLTLVGGRALLLTQWSILDTIVVSPGTLTSLGVVVAAIASAGCVLHVVVGVLRLVRPSLDLAFRGGELPAVLLAFAGFLSIVTFVALVWDQGHHPAYAYAVVVAMTATADSWISLGHAPFVVPLLILRRLTRPLAGKGVDVTPSYRHASRAGLDLVLEGNRVRSGLALDPHETEIPWRHLAAACVLPLILAFWS